MDSQYRKLYRSRTNRMVSGVCGGIAEYLNLDPTVVRLLWVLAAFLTGFIPAIIAYIVMLFIVPEAPQEPEK